MKALIALTAAALACVCFAGSSTLMDRKAQYEFLAAETRDRILHGDAVADQTYLVSLHAQMSRVSRLQHDGRVAGHCALGAIIAGIIFVVLSGWQACVHIHGVLYPRPD